jgi:Ca2+-binding EF-hand superfamily protein
MKLLMGTLDQKMLIAFRCYDVDDDQNISEDEVKIILKHIPL